MALITSRRGFNKGLLLAGAAIAAPAVYPRPLRAAEFSYKYAEQLAGLVAHEHACHGVRRKDQGGDWGTA